jgi:RNA polymerase sigma-70 factor (ECF subfamily)
MAQKSDKQLVKDYLSGIDEDALGILIQKYLKPVYGFIYSYIGDPYSAGDAEDITQEAFVRAWKNLAKFNYKKNFKTWIFSIAKNAAVDWLRAKKTVPFSAFENEQGQNVLVETIADKKPLADEIFERNSIAQTMQAAINNLLPKYQTVLSAYYNEDMNFRQIAQKTGDPINTVKSRHRRALLMLKKGMRHILD